MKNAEILSHTDRTSWSRVWMLWKFYRPVLGRKLCLFAFISLAEGLLMVFGKQFQTPDGYANIVISGSILLMFLAVFGGSMPLAKIKALEVETMLPALNFEKCAFVLIYALIVVPLVVFVPCNVVWYAANGLQSPMEIVREFMPEGMNMLNGGPSIYLTFVAVFVAFTASGLWAVMAAKRHRMLWCVGGVMLAYAGYILISFLAGMGLGIYAGFMEVAHPEQVVETGAPQMLSIVVYVMAIYAIFAVWKVCRSIYRRQL